MEDNDKEIIRFTKRRFRDAVETMKMLEDALLENFTSSITPITVQTMAMLVGDESLQFRFVNSYLQPIQYNITYNQETKQLSAPATILQHMTLGIDTITSDRSKTEYKHWNIKGYTSPVLDQLSQQYYFYAKVPTGTGEGEFVLSPTAIGMDDVSGFYHLLVGLLNSEYDGERSFVTLYGFTEVLPGRITTDKIVSADGTTYFDLENSVIGGRIKFRSTNGTEKDLSEFEDDFSKLKDDAVLKETIIEGGYLKNDLIDTNNLIVKNILSKSGNFKTLDDGTVYGKDAVFEGGTFKKVYLQGSLRNPFIQGTDAIIIGGKQSVNDNVATVSVSGGFVTAGSLDWDINQSGRRMCIVNYRWGSEYAYGAMEYTAPSGKYFFEDGELKSKIQLSRECVELIGYGTSTVFYGWIVLNRIDIGVQSRYGRKTKALAMGIVNGTSSGASITYNTFDLLEKVNDNPSRMSVSRLGTGKYRVYFPYGWFNSKNDMLVMLTGYGHVVDSSTSNVKATLVTRGTSYFDVETSDDASNNDGSFMFIMYNMADWFWF